MGQNGSGTSTLIKLVSGVHRADPEREPGSGVVVFDESSPGLDDAALTRIVLGRAKAPGNLVRR